MTTPLTFVFSGSVETFFHSLFFALIGLSVACLQRKEAAPFWFLCLLCGIASAIRAYALTFWLYPLAIALYHKKRFRSVFCFVGGGLSAALFYFCSTTLSCHYFADSENFRFLSYLLDGRLSDAAALFRHCCTSTAVFLRQGSSARNHWFFFVLFLLTLVSFFYDSCHKRPCLLKGCTLVVTGLIFGALFLFYYPLQTERHCLLLCVGLAATLLVEDARWLAAALPGLAVLFLLAGGLAVGYQTPRYDAALEAELTALNAVLTADQAALTSDDAWEHTLAYAVYDDVFHGYLYALPDGMGIQFDQTNYLADPENPISSRYVMTRPDGRCTPRLEHDGWPLLFENEQIALYVKPTP